MQIYYKTNKSIFDIIAIIFIKFDLKNLKSLKIFRNIISNSRIISSEIINDAKILLNITTQDLKAIFDK